MLQQKIRYRLVYNYAGKLNKDGYAPVAVEARQETRKVYFSTKVMLRPGQWMRGQVINHGNAAKLTAYLIKVRNEIEEVELNALLKGKSLSLSQLRTAVRTGVHAGASLRDFTMSVVGCSTRKESTKNGYRYLMNEIEGAYGKMTLSDITYDWITRWRTDMHRSDLSENTIKGRMKLLHAVCEEAKRRDLLQDDPFKYIKIGNMTPKKEYLTMAEIRRIENVRCTTEREEKVKDLFLLACWTGLRYSDLTTLEEATVSKGVLRKRMYKTNIDVAIPVDTLFWGKGKAIMDKYPDITELSHCCRCNSTANRVIKELARRAGVRKPVHFHEARKSTATNLAIMGMPLGEISNILGHAEIETTLKYYVHGREKSVVKASRKLFKKDKGLDHSLNIGKKQDQDACLEEPDDKKKEEDRGPCVSVT